jgi:hypothetical protein
VTAPSLPIATGPLPIATAWLPGLARASAALAATIMLTNMAFLAIAHLLGGIPFGEPVPTAIIDLSFALAILLMLPVPFELHSRLAAVDRGASAAAVALAVDAIVFGAILHLAFALGVTSFAAVGPLLLIGYGALAGWLLIVGSLGSRSGLLPKGRRMAVIGASIAALPVWLLWVARRP